MRSEQSSFARRLAREPLFLLRHVPALAYAITRRLKNRVVMALASPHRGRKVRPRWLRAEGRSRGAVRLAGALPSLPVYTRNASKQVGLHLPSVGIRTADRDHEDYLAEHRWGFLLERMLDNDVAWSASIDECLRWIRDNADTAGPAWEPYSACERIANVLVFFAAMPSNMRAPGIPAELREFLNRSVTWVYEHLEYYGPADTNNHILNNARALVLGGVACADRQAVSAGLQIFHRCLPVLILNGGFLRERSSHYQLIVLNWILDAWRFVAAVDGSSGAEAGFLAGYAERMRTAAWSLCERGTSLLAVVGDVSPDIAPAQTLDRLLLLYSDWWTQGEPASLGTGFVDGWFRLCKGDEIVFGNFPEGEFPAEFPTHGHSDHTSFVWLHDGQEVLVDRGRHRYTPDEVSLAQIGASGHSLPMVDGLAPLSESVLPGGGWRPLPYAAARLRATAVPDGIVLQHDGFARATPVVRHSRRIELQENGVQVVDSFEGLGTVALSFFWQFCEMFERFDTDRMLAIGRGGKVRVDVRNLAARDDSTPMAAEVLPGVISRAYGHALPSLGICLSGRVELPASFATQFSWIAGGG